jgi:hypothetical protein
MYDKVEFAPGHEVWKKAITRCNISLHAVNVEIQQPPARVPIEAYDARADVKEGS